MVQFITLDNEHNAFVATAPTELAPYTRVFYDMNILVQHINDQLLAKREQVDLDDPLAIAEFNALVAFANELGVERDILVLETEFSI